MLKTESAPNKDPPDEASTSKRQRLSDTANATEQPQSYIDAKDTKISQLEYLLMLLTQEPTVEQFYSKVAIIEMQKNQTNQIKISKLEELNRRLNSKNNSITGRIQMLEHQNNIYAFELNQKNIIIGQQAAEIQQLRSDYFLKLKELEVVRERNHPNSDYVNSLEAHIQKQLFELKELQNNLDLCKTDLANQTTQNSVLQEQNQALMEKSSGFETTNTTLESQLKAMTDEHSNLKKQHEDKLKEVADLRMSRNRVESQMAALKAKIFQLEEERQNRDVEIYNLNVVKDDLDEQLRASRAKNSELEAQHQNDLKHAEELEAAFRTMESQLKVSSANLSKGKARNKRFLATIGQLSESTLTLEKRLKMVTNTLAELKEYHQQTEKDAIQLQADNTNLKKMLDETTTKLLDLEKQNQCYAPVKDKSENGAKMSEQNQQETQDYLDGDLLRYIEVDCVQSNRINCNAIETPGPQNEKEQNVLSELNELIMKYKADATSARKAKQFKIALKYIHTAIEIDKIGNYPKEHTSSLWRMASGVLYEMNNFSAAIKCLDTAIKFDPNDSINYYKRASVCYNLKQYEQAKEDVKEALTLEPDFIKAQKLLSEVDDKLNYASSLKH